MSLVLKLTDKKRQAHHGFQWPESGPVTCPDWDPTPECGHGLHGWLNGEGDYRHSFNEGQWLVVDVPEESIVDLDGKIKFPLGNVVHCGSRTSAVAYLKERRALTETSDPAWACLTPAQCSEVAFRAADRAVRVHAPKGLRARGYVEAAERLEKLPKIVDEKSARAAADAASATYAASAADAAAYAASAADAASADAAAYAAAYAASATAAASADAADAARKTEREEVRLDKLRLLGVIG